MSNNPSAKNATKHGCCAVGTLLLPTENEQDFKALEATWCKAYNPQTEHERHLVQDIVVADWMLQRATRAQAQVEASLYTAAPNPADWTEQQERKLGRHIRYRTAQTNIVAKCVKALEDYRKARAAEKLAATRVQKVRENLPPEDWKQHLRNMRDRALAMGITPPEMPDPPRF
jgi:hypothetical protein